MSRIIRDQLCRSADLNWFDATLDKLVKDTWQVESETLTQTFLTFNTDARSHQRVGIVDRQKFNKVCCHGYMSCLFVVVVIVSVHFLSVFLYACVTNTKKIKTNNFFMADVFTQ